MTRLRAAAAATILVSTFVAVASRSLQQPSDVLPQLLHSEVAASDMPMRHGRELLLEVVYDEDELTTGFHCEIAGTLDLQYTKFQVL